MEAKQTAKPQTGKQTLLSAGTFAPLPEWAKRNAPPEPLLTIPLVPSRLAPLETDTKLVTVIEGIQGGVDARIGDFVPKGGKLGFDPWLHTPGEIKDLSQKLGDGVTLVPSANLVDAIHIMRAESLYADKLKEVSQSGKTP